MATKQVKVMTFNKKNAQKFADMIYTDRGGMVSFTKLCDGALVQKDGKRQMHCAIGEAYFHFVGKTMPREEENYESHHLISSDGQTAKAIDHLVEAAQLKNKSSKKKLALALDECVSSNDYGSGEDAFCSRAEHVAYTWRQEVLPLLK